MTDFRDYAEYKANILQVIQIKNLALLTYVYAHIVDYYKWKSRSRLGRNRGIRSVDSYMVNRTNEYCLIRTCMEV